MINVVLSEAPQAAEGLGLGFRSACDNKLFQFPA